MLIFNTIQIIILILIGLATLYIFVFSIAGLFYKQRTYKPSADLKKIAVLIPGYKEDEVIIEVANAALQQNYPSNLYDVVIIADSFLEETLNELKSLPLKLIEVSFEKSTKSKALNKAMAALTDKYDIAVILDADNLMETDFLKKINTSFEQGHIAVQGHRTAKNTNNSWAILDAVSEEINNHIFRKGHIVLGLSSAIIGSGMAFKYDFFKSLMSTVKAVGGFDKEIELKMLKDGHKIAYLNDAMVYDEKIQKAEVFGNQRRRWLSAQLHYFRKDFLSALKDLILKGNVDYFDKAIQFIQPPRVLLLGSVIIFGGLFILSNYLLDNEIYFSISWLIVATACVLSFLFSIPKSFYTMKTLKAVASLPKGMFTMLLSLLRIKGANKKFIHTKHSSNT
ncbi:Glycosyltransferase, catalytic subunit of cellulose synthase and poly-beta-1,6-N-acetylglucosamine synthase [Lutibacter agarilyticus]|uniref:Glycosyltransferase, catalytic subunit of cellulose synthase and poly-beta-1,6-N-acetylglucosamine synthase n=1 Tax=Lutibacter agarilyticus TaxID=1109740 RepID=A0A238XY71_9FLAO|nr:glycosyltransferase [Lutibacter agarilyticus]SNR63945.1 Glycosyltransferase, catalytic subunit of cellulose synthase and poly-beta-1,6-N-acetylglucosamine synthase [Lutibacter agarilyticus]